jgi:predicted O-methyltransferase YrrM
MAFWNEPNSERSKVAAEIRRLAPNIGKDTEEVLADMYTAKQLSGTTSDQPISLVGTTKNCGLGPAVGLVAGIDIAQGAQINELVRQSGAIRSLEIGFAYGFSTTWILDALRSHTNSGHVAVDPFEITLWGGVGLAQVKRLNPTPNFEWISEHSIHALSNLIKSQLKYDFIYIDGNHRFDDVLVDFYLSDQLASPGGLMVFDDMWMPSVQTVINFILRNRQYEIVPQPIQNIMVLKKLSDDNRDWRHFESFKVPKGGDGDGNSANVQSILTS